MKDHDWMCCCKKQVQTVMQLVQIHTVNFYDYHIFHTNQKLTVISMKPTADTFAIYIKHVQKIDNLKFPCIQRSLNSYIKKN